MSRLNELIQELCPDGVEYKKVKDVYKRLRGTSITATKMKEINISSGEIRIFAGGKTVINAREKDIPKANITRVPAVLVQSRGIVDVIYYEKPFTFKNEMWAYTAKDKIEVKFLFYMFKNNIMKFREAASGTGSLPQISLSVTEEFLIPVPPIEVQHEIVRILDNFTELTTELTTELIARKKQYEYYRDYLLSHKRYEVRLIPVGELFDFKNGINKGKESFGAGTPIVNFTNVFRKNKIYSSELQGRVQVTDEEIERYSAKKGDVFFTRTSETKEEIGITSVLMEDIDRCVFSGFILRARPKTELLLPEYCAYCFSSTEARKYIVRHSTYTTRALTNGTVLSKMILPVPPLHIQKKIVDVLDNFDAICKDLDIGLPAEIEARQKQYEYYRDMLLTFVETGDTILPDQTRPDQTRPEIIKFLQYVFGYAPLKLGEIAKIARGGNFQKKDFSENGVACIHYGQIYTHYGIYANKTISKINMDAANKAKFARKNDIIMAVTSENMDDVCKCVAWLGNEEIAVSGHTAIIKHNQNPKYLSYYFNSNKFFKHKRALAHGTKVIEVIPDNLKDIIINLPSIEAQNRIVEILDYFDNLCSNLSDGLPAEIEARQKQYEYYRDKLLTFNELKHE